MIELSVMNLSMLLKTTVQLSIHIFEWKDVLFAVWCKIYNFLMFFFAIFTLHSVCNSLCPTVFCRTSHKYPFYMHTIGSNKILIDVPSFGKFCFEAMKLIELMLRSLW